LINGENINSTQQTDLMNPNKTTLLLWPGCAALAIGFLAPLPAPAQPVIITQPANQFIGPRATAYFAPLVSGALPITYQWLFNGTPIVGATSRTLVFTKPPQTNQWGYYSFIASNAFGSVTSQVAELKVFVPEPHRLQAIQSEAGGSISLTLAGETTAPFGRYFDLYPLETSSNLFDWVPLATLQRVNTALEQLRFDDTNVAQFSQRFYRTPTNQLATPDPVPTGPYSVGTFSMVMTDSSRTNASGITNYQFMTTFWYPTTAQTGVLPAKYVEGQIALGNSFWNLSGSGGGDFGSQVQSFFSHSFSNAPLATNLAKYPVVLYDPGFECHRRENTDKAEELASWGFVVVGLDTSDTYVSVFPNGKVAYGQPVNNLQQGYANYEGRVRDMQFVLDQLEVLNSGDPRLAGRLNLDRIATFGFSRGGGTAARLCLRDPRCKACAALDGAAVETNLLTQPLHVPYLFVRSGWSPDPDPGVVFGDGRPDDRLEIYNEQSTNAYWVKLGSTVHGSLADPGLIVDVASLAAVWGTPLSGQFLPGPRVSQMVRAYLLSFFNKFLYGEDDHLLDGPSPAYPEVVQFLSTSRVAVPPEYPSASLLEADDGSFYGTTAYGGESGKGTVFKVTTNGALTIVFSFNGTNGSHPATGLIRGMDGNLYGTTTCGGTNGNNGTVFQLTPGGVLTTLVSFTGSNGKHPAAALVQSSDGTFYGTTLLGGARNLGTVFQMTSGGALTSLVSFNGGNGSAPYTSLVQGTNGDFYGTTSIGSTDGSGTVFRMTPAGRLVTLATISGINGWSPSAGFVLATNGILYGTTAYGGDLSLNGTWGFGSVFKMTPTGSPTALASFGSTDGSYCMSGLIQGSDGDFYGTTAGGGTSGCGTVYKMTSTGVVTTLASFNGANGNSPQARLVEGSDGNFYGTTTYGGPGGGGTVFQMTPAGSLKTLVAFGSQMNSM
jgi:uncharacterized repeat protein (TIGR03803 family)